MDLFNLLMQRKLNQPAPTPTVPPNPDPKVPPATQRFNNAQAIQDAYRNGWAPNPVLLQAQLK